MLSSQFLIRPNQFGIDMTDLTTEQQDAAQTIQDCYEKLAKDNVVKPLLEDSKEIRYWQHYPIHDVKDPKNFTQYYFHAHKSTDPDRVKEHGHFHIFFMTDIIDNKNQYIVASDKYLASEGSKDKLTHLIAISVDQFGRPLALFTVNYWVTNGLWYPAEVLIPLLDKFVIQTDHQALETTNKWITAMIALFKPQIIELLYKRDTIIDAEKDSADDKTVYFDKNLEITSVLDLV